MAAEEQPTRRRATTAERREQQLISAAVDLAEEQIRSGTASAMVVTHFLRLGSSREKVEQERIRNENLLAQAKIRDLDSRARTEELMREALQAMRNYSGNGEDGDYER